VRHNSKPKRLKQHLKKRSLSAQRTKKVRETPANLIRKETTSQATTDKPEMKLKARDAKDRLSRLMEMCPCSVVSAKLVSTIPLTSQRETPL